MPIVTTRSGELLQAPALTAEQKKAAWEYLICNWARSHRQELKEPQHTPKEPVCHRASAG